MISPATLLEHAVERAPLTGHDGRSGARLERVVLDDGTRLVVKRTSPTVDLVMAATGAIESREAALWHAGVLDDLPAGVGSALVGAWREGDESVLAMRDLGESVVGWSRRISREECRRLLAAATLAHRKFAGRSIEGLIPLAVRVSIFAPWRMRAVGETAGPLPAIVLRGWERFAETADPVVAAAVLEVLERPERLAGPLARRPTTLIHGDLWLVNVAFEAHQITLLDWDLATSAPPALELALFLVGNSSQLDATRDQIVDDFRTLWGDEHDDVALRLALFAGLVELGWNKALDVAEHPDRAVRAREQADLDWWIDQARHTLELGLLDPASTAAETAPLP